MIFLAKNYLSRADLNKAVSAEVGLSIQKNKDESHIIKGTRDQLKKLHLSDTCVFFGCKVVITDRPTKKLLEEKYGAKSKK